MLTHHRSSPAAPLRVVVLGARGFVGGATVRALQQSGTPVEAISSAEIDLTAAGSDKALASRLKAEDALVFVSALTPDKGKNIATLMRNLEMGRHVSAALADRPCAHVVYVSSDAVYHDEANPVRETSCCQPSSFHGLMHLTRERMLIETLREAKVPLTILRPSLVYGPGDTHNGYGPNRFVRTAAKDRRIALFGGGEEKRDHVFIRDVSQLIELVLQHRAAGVLNVATGHSVSFYAVACAVAELTGPGVAVETSARNNPITHRHFDITATVQAFPGFRFSDVRDGLKTTLEELRAVQPA
jgi:nucleoside-diphosphate-sugar epimerase